MAEQSDIKLGNSSTNGDLQASNTISISPLYLGFDLSTQQLKAIVINDNNQVVYNANVAFDAELGEYRTKGGVCRNANNSSNNDENIVLAPVNMWLKALDLCLDKLKLAGLNFANICAISGSAQQHGSVWWKNGSDKLLESLNPDEFLHKQLVSSFTLRETPIWMDSSTTEECKQIEDLVGGPIKLAEITGSRAYERFTGPQIAKIIKTKPDIFAATERITLVSNFLASIFIGGYAPFDHSDASGMNLMDIQIKNWSKECLDACANNDELKSEQLMHKLGATIDSSNIVSSDKIIGNICEYFVERHGFNKDCKIVSFTGDNPASMAGLCVREDELLLSLGTSDTAIFSLKSPKPTLNGHILRNPIDKDLFMGLICFKNGSITRERVRNKCAGGSWDEFSTLINSVPRGNHGRIGFYFDMCEIYPLCKGDFRFNNDDEPVKSFSSEFEARACIEGQFLRLLYHSRQMGLDTSKVKRVIVTGGASENKAILSVISDIFQRSVFTIDTPNSACLGAALLAQFGVQKLTNKSKTFEQANSPKLCIEYKQYKFNEDVYERLLERYVSLEQKLNC